MYTNFNSEAQNKMPTFNNFFTVSLFAFEKYTILRERGLRILENNLGRQYWTWSPFFERFTLPFLPDNCLRLILVKKKTLFGSGDH